MALTNFARPGYSRRTDDGGRPQQVTKQSATRQQVLDLIEQLGVGTAIPSERQLSADLGVSRLTVRAALDDLAREGYVVRRRGSGTYVQQPEDRAGADDDLLQRGHAPARDGARQPHALARARARRRPARAAPPRLAVRGNPGDQAACGSPTARRWRSRRCTSRSALVPGSRPKDLDRLVLRAPPRPVRRSRSRAARRRSSRR